jgi:hypothetical protein
LSRYFFSSDSRMVTQSGKSSLDSCQPTFCKTFENP